VRVEWKAVGNFSGKTRVKALSSRWWQYCLVMGAVSYTEEVRIEVSEPQYDVPAIGLCCIMSKHAAVIDVPATACQASMSAPRSRTHRLHGTSLQSGTCTNLPRRLHGLSCHNCCSSSSETSATHLAFSLPVNSDRLLQDTWQDLVPGSTAISSLICGSTTRLAVVLRILVPSPTTVYTVTPNA
jgi:hypothetical protein